jgi:hypothetical protein
MTLNRRVLTGLHNEGTFFYYRTKTEFFVYYMYTIIVLKSFLRNKLKIFTIPFFLQRNPKLTFFY